MSRSAILSTAIVMVTILAGSASSEDPGSRPMNVAVSPNGNVILATSMGSTKVTQVKLSGLSYVISYIEVDEPSWGITFVTSNVVVVTHPGATILSVLTRPKLSGSFSKDRDVEIGDQGRYATEVIAKPGTNDVFAANRGKPLNGQESWTNAIIRVNVDSDAITGTMVTEREPRALALSPDGNRLYVGHIQGSLGGPPLTPNNSLADNYQGGAYLGDGGSILVYDISSWEEPELPSSGERIGVGSPVRGIACSGNTDGTYVVYFTSVGDNANSEDPGTSPAFGGREIPNVISELYYNSSHALQSVQNAVFNHKPDWAPSTSLGAMDGLPVVLPDKIAIRDYTSGGQRKRELFVVNSGSGTLSRTPLDSNGRLLTYGAEMVVPIRLTRNTDNTFTIHDQTGLAFPVLQIVTDQAGTFNVSHVDLSRSGQLTFTSNARAIAYDPSADKVWVATQFDNELIRVTATDYSTSITQRFTIGAAVASTDQRNFFGFGRGFEFRELDHGKIGDEQPRVGNQTCATCHVDGHLDGKVRLTKRRLENKLPANSLRKPVAVPSCFDVQETEWIFFEGTRTIVDGEFEDDTDCNYCDATSFFDDTEAFTNALASPRSPHNWTGTLAANSLRGRYVFESMNCSRCHMGPTGLTFTRTQDPEAPSPLEGPLGGLAAVNPFLHDATQVFISGVDSPNDNLSLRNMTDVGTRPSGDGEQIGINTPALAGAWDNRPYMHDGRYRTLDDVLSHTWLKEDDASRAASLVTAPTVPDNAFNGDIDSLFNAINRNLFKFRTHAANSPGTGWSSVGSALSPTDYADLKTFLLSLSSQTDPCSGGPVDYIQNFDFNGPVVTWTTPVKVKCSVVWDGPQYVSTTTAYGTSHSSQAPSQGLYIVTVTPLVRPLCGEPDSETEVIGGDFRMPIESGDLPVITAMSAGRPNPFNPSTTIAFSLANDSDISLVVFDAAGRRVRTLVEEHRKRERYSVEWDGRDDQGSPVASGVYFCRMIVGSYNSTQKLVLLK